jgi:hypothetical protein
MAPEEITSPLTDEELRAIREILEQERNVMWFWATARKWLAWSSAGVLGAYAMWNAVKDVGTAIK